MKFLIAILSSVAIASTAVAVETKTATNPDAVKNVVGAGTMYASGEEFRAVLVENEGQADLLIFKKEYNQTTNSDVLKLVLSKPNIVTTPAGLTVSNKGSLIISSEWAGFGRDRWNSTMTIVNRNGQFILAGIQFTSVDSLQEYPDTNCDLNLLTGTGKIGKKSVIVDKTPLNVSNLNDDTISKYCKF